VYNGDASPAASLGGIEMKRLLVAVVLLSCYDSIQVRGSTITVEPDAFSAGTNISALFSGATLSVEDRPGAGGEPPISTSIFSMTELSSTGSRGFAFQVDNGEGGSGFQGYFVENTELLRVDFGSSVASVWLDIVCDDDSDPGILEAYDSAGHLLQRVQTLGAVGYGLYETASILRPSADIAYVFAAGYGSNGARLDNLRFSADVAPEPSALVLLCVGAASLFAYAWRRRRQAA
jgi:hypothetical protein